MQLVDNVENNRNDNNYNNSDKNINRNVDVNDNNNIDHKKYKNHFKIIKILMTVKMLIIDTLSQYLTNCSSENTVIYICNTVTFSFLHRIIIDNKI